MKLNPEAVRRRGNDMPNCVEIPVRGEPEIVSFLVNQEARVTIYCETGTISIGRIAPWETKPTIRHIFRRNISQLDVVERFLRNPPQLTSIDSSLVIQPDGDQENENENIQRVKTLQSNLELMDVGIAILEGERDKLKDHVQHLQPIEPSKNNANNGAEGMEFQFSLPAEPMKHVDQCLRDISAMGRLVKSVSTNGKGTVFLYGNGGVAYTPSIPRPLYHKLSQLRKTKNRESRPSYVALSTRDRFFVSFHDGTFAFKGPKGLEKELRKAKQPPASVAFGTTYDTFFVVFKDGSWKYEGRGIPEELQLKLEDRQERADLKCVNLGPAGEWFLRAKNGRMWWGGISEEMDQSIQMLLDDGHCLSFLDFGETGSYFISYD
ncbi:hypothetical protein FisN_1Hh577 [Fistulifera solaris]|jgi:hypothetical protein|uniref:Uncharacterized protein n=1 Tax=Fistulifera solaris TaxID=1519565 RepID=A0A1Z5KRA4_FISSO|nr:hypothetical protein FisN_1Hh577 [Fistulifera solaris]|eukprot:GAX28632.1 hypothetical protein FisN_1Hh577 [Fistulifera solaris]